MTPMAATQNLFLRLFLVTPPLGSGFSFFFPFSVWAIIYYGCVCCQSWLFVKGG